MKAKLLILIVVILIVAIAGVVWVRVSGWPPIIIRNREYRELIADFQQAQLRDKIWRNGENAGWEFQVVVPERETTVRVSAVPHPGVVRIKYLDEDETYDLYEYVDYSHPGKIKTAENILYVYWTETLFGTDYWLLAYDLARRREIVRRKIDPDDLGQSH